MQYIVCTVQGLIGQPEREVRISVDSIVAWEDDIPSTLSALRTQTFMRVHTTAGQFHVECTLAEFEKKLRNPQAL